MRYPTYDSYKSSSVDWIDQVPSHWDTWKVTHGFGMIGSGTTPKSDNRDYYDDGETSWITTSELREAIILDTKYKLTKKALNDYSTLKVYKPGALAFAMYGATIGRLGILGINAAVNQACCVFDDPEKFHTKFFFYWLWMRRNVLISLSAGGGQPNLSQDDLKQIRAPIPTVSEQQKIAVFLDYKTEQFDELIKKKKSLIEKLEEKRIAIITQAVTKGLDKDAKLKSSGVDWLGDVPEHWGVVKFKYYIAFQEGPGIMAVDFRDEGVPLLRIKNVQGECVDIEGCNFLDHLMVRKTWEHFRCKDGDLIISGSASTGLVSEVKGDAVGSVVYTGLIRLWPCNDKIEKEYIRLLVASELFFSQIEQFKTGSTIQHFGPEHLRQMLITLPPVEEQIPIVEKAKLKISYIERLVDRACRAVEKLEEYRSALITSAVTGKIDVRGVELPKDFT